MTVKELTTQLSKTPENAELELVVCNYKVSKDCTLEPMLVVAVDDTTTRIWMADVIKKGSETDKRLKAQHPQPQSDVVYGWRQRLNNFLIHQKHAFLALVK